MHPQKKKAPMAKFTQQQKLYRKIQKQFNRATKDYSMFADGDKILVALSGGKDSLTLLQLMAERSRIFKPSIKIVAAHVTMVNIPYKANLSYLQEFCDGLGVELHIMESSFDASTDKRKSPCFLCSWNRRKALFTLAQEIGCNKIALGHHKDDLIETLLMNLIFQGSVSTIPPLLQMEKMPIQMIRPLCLIEEKDLARYAELSEYEKQIKLCPLEKVSNRATMKELVKKLEELNPNVRDSIWSAMENIKEGYLPKKIK